MQYLYHIDCSAQENRNSNTNTLELHFSCINPSILVLSVFYLYYHYTVWHISHSTDHLINADKTSVRHKSVRLKTSIWYIKESDWCLIYFMLIQKFLLSVILLYCTTARASMYLPDDKFNELHPHHKVEWQLSPTSSVSPCTYIGNI